MLKTMLTSMGSELPGKTSPTNVVAEFVDKEIHILMPGNEDVVDIFQGVYVGIANRDPNRVLKLLVCIHNDIGNLVKEIQTQELIDAAPPEEIEEDIDEDDE